MIKEFLFFTDSSGSDVKSIVMGLAVKPVHPQVYYYCDLTKFSSFSIVKLKYEIVF